VSSRKRRRVDFSQNFVRYPSLARRIVRKAAITRDDLVLEIGPGKGILTRGLASRAGQVVAIEKDSLLAEEVRERLGELRNVEIIATDFFGYPLPSVPYKVFASIPYNATAAIIDRLTLAENPPEDCYLVVQREAAERFIGEPRTTMVSVLLHPWYSLSVLHRFRRRDFSPTPRVDSVLLRIERRMKPLIEVHQRVEFRDFVAYGFNAWQPDLRTAFRNVLGQSYWREARDLGVDLTLRPSQFPVIDWLRLFNFLLLRVPKSRRIRMRGAYRRLRSQQVKVTKSHRTRTRSHGRRR
jgi:23S rRNA (adenine-N6)-dimethyltransferase